jgi:hypothetical protein
MKLTGFETLETCLSGDFVFRCRFDGMWKGEEILALAVLGTVRRRRDFPRPMFEVRCPGGTVIKGLEEGSEFRLIFSPGSSTAYREAFKTQITEIASLIQ